VGPRTPWGWGMLRFVRRSKGPSNFPKSRWLDGGMTWPGVGRVQAIRSFIAPIDLEQGILSGYILN
jgi:hypothetical protein